jgi:hypothetical protein
MGSALDVGREAAFQSVLCGCFRIISWVVFCINMRFVAAWFLQYHGTGVGIHGMLNSIAEVMPSGQRCKSCLLVLLDGFAPLVGVHPIPFCKLAHWFNCLHRHVSLWAILFFPWLTKLVTVPAPVTPGLESSSCKFVCDRKL